MLLLHHGRSESSCKPALSTSVGHPHLGEEISPWKMALSFPFHTVRISKWAVSRGQQHVTVHAQKDVISSDLDLSSQGEPGKNVTVVGLLAGVLSLWDLMLDDLRWS